MEKKYFIIVIFVMTIILLLETISAIPKEDFRLFLNSELIKYFEDKPTLLPMEDLRKAVNLYFTSTNNDIDIENSGLSVPSIIILKNISTNMPQEFTCSLVATAKEKYKTEDGAAMKTGYRIQCCTRIICAPFACKCSKDAKYTECEEIKASKFGPTLKQANEACKGSFGEDWKTAPTLILRLAKGDKKCQYSEKKMTEKEEDRIETETVTLSLGRDEMSKEIPVALKVYPTKEAGEIKDVKYKISCKDQKISAQIVEGNIQVKKIIQ